MRRLVLTQVLPSHTNVCVVDKDLDDSYSVASCYVENRLVDEQAVVSALGGEAGLEVVRRIHVSREVVLDAMGVLAHDLYTSRPPTSILATTMWLLDEPGTSRVFELGGTYTRYEAKSLMGVSWPFGVETSSLHEYLHTILGSFACTQLLEMMP